MQSGDRVVATCGFGPQGANPLCRFLVENERVGHANVGLKLVAPNVPPITEIGPGRCDAPKIRAL